MVEDRRPIQEVMDDMRVSEFLRWSTREVENKEVSVQLLKFIEALSFLFSKIKGEKTDEPLNNVHVRSMIEKTLNEGAISESLLEGARDREEIVDISEAVFLIDQLSREFTGKPWEEYLESLAIKEVCGEYDLGDIYNIGSQTANSIKEVLNQWSVSNQHMVGLALYRLTTLTLGKILSHEYVSDISTVFKAMSDYFHYELRILLGKGIKQEDMEKELMELGPKFIERFGKVLMKYKDEAEERLMVGNELQVTESIENERQIVNLWLQRMVKFEIKDLLGNRESSFPQ